MGYRVDVDGLMKAARGTNASADNALTVAGKRSVFDTLNVDHLRVLR